jgi:Zn-dependent metalloprotease
MNNIHHHTCFVIPPHILRRAGAEETLEQMRELTSARTAQAFIAANTPNTAPMRRNRRVYDDQHKTSLPGKLVRTEHRSTGGDVEVAEAWDGSGATFDFYARAFGRNSIDGRGMRIDSTVHYGRRFVNAMWNGSQMVYGDGDGRLFNRFTVAKDVIAHELTHGVTQFTAGLGYSGQTGALNEHISDAFGIMVKQSLLGQTVHDSDWIIGAGLFTSRVHGQGIRSMAAPGTAYDDPILGRDPQPSHMSGYVNTEDDNGGVHINSGIPNHAFYLAAIGIGGFTWPVLGKIWYAALTERLQSDADFATFAKATVDVAGKYGSDVQRIVAEAWSEVGLPVAGFACTSATAHAARRPGVRQFVSKSDVAKRRSQH